ncbi:hypothetical protein [Priestia megaterium]
MDEKDSRKRPREITSKEQLISLLENRPTHTETWLVNSSVAENLQPKTDGMRKMTQEEVNELAQYLDVKEDDLEQPFYVDERLVCPDCNRSLTFLDFIKTAIKIEEGFHSKGLIADILCGRNGHWITVGGKNMKRTVYCTNCEYGITYTTHNYNNSRYAYA